MPDPTPPADRLSRRTLLVTALLLGQLACFLGALLIFGHWLEDGLNRVVRQRVLDNNQQIASQFGVLLDNLELTTLEPTSDDWGRAQDLIENFTLPNGAFLCLVDAATGNVINHPRLRANPKIAEQTVSQAINTKPDLLTSEPAKWRAIDGTSHLLIARSFPKLGVKLLVHQPETQLRALVGAFVQRARLIGIVVTVCVVALSALLSFVIIRTYDNRLSSINEQLEQIVEQRSRSVVRSRDAVIFGLAMLAEKRDGETGEHLERIGDYTELLAREMTKRLPQLDERWVHTLKVCSALHDVGKVGIPDAVLRKPAQLTEEERKIIQQHPYIGGDTLLELKRRWGEDQFLTTAAQICLGHHEHWDGGGYPFKLKGDEIPLPARIVALADVYDALTSRRAYKERLGHEQTKAMIIEGSGTQFDPQVVEAFLACEKDFEQVAFNARRETVES